MLQMFLPSHAKRVVIYPQPVSTRLGPDRLRKLCEEDLGVSPVDGTVLLFFNRKRTR